MEKKIAATNRKAFHEYHILDTYEAGITVDCTITFLAYNISEQLRFKFDQANGLV